MTSRDDAFDRFIAGLYRTGLSLPPEGFRDWALRQLQQLIPYDGAMWGSGTAEQWRFHTVTLVGVDPDYPRQLEETRSINPILPRMLSNLDTPVDMEQVLPDREFFRSEIYRRCFGRFGIERILATAHADPRSGLLTILSLYRKSRRSHFTPAERQLQKRATYHLFQGASHAFFLHLMHAFSAEREAGGAAAVIDRQGAFYEAQPQFLDLLDQHFPGRQPHEFPLTLPPPGETRTEGRLCVKTQPLGDLSCVLIWPAGPLDRLTSREREIVFAVTQGLSFKQAARKIGVAPSTVANHLYRIYRKIGVNSRSELASLVYPGP
ncbi:MAG TPA: helix-turn-helix transcriptional regulator [Candidatus Binatia bacterium]|nr:helix-turn-helix transcriptional regulator [Candidatus Binatia bacterium]